ncbi:fructose PTS transporter subunit IIA, partial [Cronobacter sakazakii]|uniref:fructose PTS transporter subunit IIA n=1 Tax=Cronobacter sakazakii TaxID=28141 RepID=UPI0020CB2043
MNLRALTDPALIQILAPFTTRDEAIAALAGLLAAHGKLHDRTAFVNEVMQREALGPTALGEGLAVPHGKCAAVREAAFAVATLREPVVWQGVEGDEPVRLIFLLAIPVAQAGTTHIQLLTELTTLLVDDAVREAAINAPCAEALLAILEARPLPPPVASGSADQPVVVCVTACPAGIAHTYMAAEYLERAGRRLGITVYTEKQGANGIEGRLT